VAEWIFWTADGGARGAVPVSTQAPCVSVLLPAYNAEKTLAAALASVLEQSVRDIEVVLVDDGSTDGTLRIAEGFKDPRLRILRGRHRGQVSSRNRGLDACRGEYIAMQDADDISEARRFALQVQRLSQDPRLTMVCSNSRIFGLSRGRTFHPQGHDEIKASMMFGLVATQPTAMLRRSALAGFRYDPAFPCSQDHDLFSRLAWAGHRFAVLPQALVRYRASASQVGNARRELQRSLGHKVRRRWLKKLGLVATPAEFEVHCQASNLSPWGRGLDAVSGVRAWFDRLESANRATELLDPLALRRVLGRRWFSVCYRNLGLGLPVVRAYAEAPYANKGLLFYLERGWVQAVERFT
jgi:glycosyltransferase involved in cell wall biosynthesis